MKIAIMGIRGIPANYGGFETFTEELAPRLVARGHEVTVYGRSNIIKYEGQFYKGVRIKILPTISHKYLDTIIHTSVCAFHSLFNRHDVILICNSINSIFSWLPRVTGQKVALNVDGLEWQRKKWNKLGQNFYRVSECLATFIPDAIVTDSKCIQQYYLKKFAKDSTFIPYGGPTEKVPTDGVLKKYNLQKEGYVLYVSRLEPENNAHLVVKAFERVNTAMNLVVVGDAPYSTNYIQELRKTRDSRIIFTGYIFGQGYKELQSHAYFYVQATEVGGTHPALLEGMGFGNCVLANDVPEHREVLSDAGLYFTTRKSEDLRNKMQYLLDNPEIVNKYQKKAVNRIKESYTWDKITEDYEKLFLRMLRE